MVKRGETKIQPPRVNVESVSLTKKKLNIKETGAWRYPNNEIKRSLGVGGPRNIVGQYYIDDREVESNLGRRAIESNFFITLNTNRAVGGGPAEEAGKLICKQVTEYLSTDRAMCTYFKFGPKSDHYKYDKFADVIHKCEWKAAVEVGETLRRLHVHIWLTVNHYSQIQINMPMMQDMFREQYNSLARTSGYEADLRIRGRPYINVKLLPTSDWAMVMRQYIQKAMGTEGPIPENFAQPVGA